MAKLVARLLTMAALWIGLDSNPDRHLTKKQMGDISKEVGNTLQPAKSIQKRISRRLLVLEELFDTYGGSAY